LPKQRPVGLLPQLRVGKIAGADWRTVSFKRSRGGTIPLACRAVTWKTTDREKLLPLGNRLGIGRNRILFAGCSRWCDPRFAFCFHGRLTTTREYPHTQRGKTDRRRQRAG